MRTAPETEVSFGAPRLPLADRSAREPLKRLREERLRKAGAGDELEVPAVVRDRLPLQIGEYHPRARALD